MAPVADLKRIVPPADAGRASDVLRRIRDSGFFGADQIQLVHDVYFSPEGPSPGSAWDALRDAHLALPEWFRPGLDPYGAAYAGQQQRLWRLVAGVDRDYDAALDEREADWGGIDAVRFPGYYLRRDPLAVSAASDHVIATGMLLKHGGLAPGDWALEYGAGFGQTALALARLGVNVDTVDVSARFCDWVREQASFFGVPLTPFEGRFGDAPRPGQRYRLIWFYESFHHCVDFERVVRALPGLLAPGGRVILAGEPIVERSYEALPYPWGLRLHSEVVAVVRRQRWFELGFSEDFLFELFAHAGFAVERIDCEPSPFGRLYVCTHRPARIAMATRWMPPVLALDWPLSADEGRDAVDGATLPIERDGQARTIELDVANRGPVSLRGSFVAGDRRTALALRPGQAARVPVDVPASADRLSWTRADATTPLARLRAAASGGDGLVVRAVTDTLANAPADPGAPQQGNAGQSTMEPGGPTRSRR